MNENGGKSSTILLTVIGIATLLVVVVGATFAYFAAQVNGNDTSTSVLITASSQGTTIQFTGGEENNLSGIYPREDAWLIKDVQIQNSAVSGSASTATYTFGLEVTQNTYTPGDLQYTFTKKSVPQTATSTSEVATPTDLVNSTPDIGHGTVNLVETNTIIYTFNLYYVNKTDVNQNPGSGDKNVKFRITQNWVENNKQQ